MFIAHALRSFKLWETIPSSDTIQYQYCLPRVIPIRYIRGLWRSLASRHSRSANSCSRYTYDSNTAARTRRGIVAIITHLFNPPLIIIAVHLPRSLSQLSPYVCRVLISVTGKYNSTRHTGISRVRGGGGHRTGSTNKRSFRPSITLINELCHEN